MPWKFDSDRTVYIQLVEEIERCILSGRLPLGSKIASVRDMAQQAAVNPNTMQKAMQELERRGLVYTQRTNGRFITEDRELVEKVRSEIAQSYISSFQNNMQNIGFSNEKIIEILKEG